jgi:hypothetical protein
VAEIRAGARLRASTLNALTPTLGRLASDFPRASATLAATGLGVPVAAGALYAVTGFLPYMGPVTADVKVALVAPAGCTGSWGGLGVATTSVDTDGNVSAARAAGFAAANVLAFGTADAALTDVTLAMLGGTLQVGATGGTLTVHMAQNTANATATTLLAGAWLRLFRIID